MMMARPLLPRIRPRLILSTSSQPDIAIASYHSTNSPRSLPPTFQSMPILHKVLKKNLHQMKFERMTEVQHKAYRPIRDGIDVNILAPEESGKTLAFLLPFLNQKLIPHLLKKGIHCVFLTPDSHNATVNYLFTSELLQIMGPNITVQAVYDSYSYQRQVQRLCKKIPTILIATPSRLREHLEQTVLIKKNRKGKVLKRLDFPQKFTELTTTLVLDEADVLMRDHWDDLQFIRQYIAMNDDSKRHTILLSSQEFPKQDLAKQWLRESSVTIDCRIKPQAASPIQPKSGIVFADAKEIQEKQRLLRKKWIRSRKQYKIDWRKAVTVSADKAYAVTRPVKKNGVQNIDEDDSDDGIESEEEEEEEERSKLKKKLD